MAPRHPLSACSPEHELPLAHAELASAVRQGLGRARLHADRHGLRGHEAIVVGCCLADPSYDPQCEGRDPRWWLDLAEIAGVVPQVLTELAAPVPQSDFRFWDTNWRVKVAAELARRGHARGLDLLLSMCGPVGEDSDVIGVEEAIELAGAQGLLTLAERIGGALIEDPERFYGADFLDLYDARFGAGEALRLLRASASRALDAFMAHIAQDDARERPRIRDPRFPPPRVDGHEFLRHFDSIPPPRPRFLGLHWRRDASDADRVIVFERLLQEREPEAIIVLCGCFTRHGFPHYAPRVRELLTHDDLEVRRNAWTACCTVDHPQVRELIDQAILADALTPDMVDAMRANWREADEPVLIRALRETADENERHGFGLAVTRMAPHVPADLTRVLEWAYATTPCENCRTHAVRELVRRDALRPGLRAEIAADSCSDVRTAVDGTDRS